MTDFNISCFFRVDTSLVCDLSFESGEGNVSMIHLKPKGPFLCILQNCNGDRSAEQHELIKSLLPLTTSRLSRVLTFSSLLIKRLANSHLGIEKKHDSSMTAHSTNLCSLHDRFTFPPLSRHPWRCWTKFDNKRQQFLWAGF